jgi:tetratricopeptide (TPR) repeat protein
LFKKVIKNKKNYEIQSKGISLKILKNYEESMNCYDKAIQLDPFFSYAFNNKGILLSSVNRKDDALVCFDKAIEIDANYADAFKNKGLK